jgi:hypothetical protein
MLFDAEQRHKGKNAALAVVTDTHRNDDVFHRCDDDQCPYDQGQHTKYHIWRGCAFRHAEHGLERIQRAGADIAKDNPKGGQAQCGQPGPAARSRGVGVRRGASLLAHQSKVS